MTGGHFLDELTLADVIPLLLNHLVTELAHELDVSRFGFERLRVEVAEDVAVGCLH